MTRAGYIHCRNPRRCGVAEHRAGTAAAGACQRQPARQDGWQGDLDRGRTSGEEVVLVLKTLGRLCRAAITRWRAWTTPTTEPTRPSSMQLSQRRRVLQARYAKSAPGVPSTQRERLVDLALTREVSTYSRRHAAWLRHHAPVGTEPLTQLRTPTENAANTPPNHSR